jgi:hypothetical protein
MGSKRYRADLRFVVFDVPVLAGVDLRDLPWQDRRERLELLAQAFELPVELSPLVEPQVGLVDAMRDGRLEGIVLKDRRSTSVPAHGPAGRRSRTRAGTNARPGGSSRGLGRSPGDRGLP